MPFNIVDVENGTLIRVRNRLLEYETATEATAVAKEYAANHPGHKYKIKAVAIDDSAWIAREQARMDDGTYVRVPFQEVWWNTALGRYTARDLGHNYAHYVPVIGIAKTHFAHVSMANKAMLAYTESSEKGAKDIQTQIKPGAYLQKYFGAVLSVDEIANIVRDWQRRYADTELKFARTPEEIARIYQAGPSSCMSGRPDQYQTNTEGDYRHPCEVYGQPHSDLTLAYLESKHGVSCRTLVWEEKKQFGRIYGDATLLQRELQALGYVQGGFNGARIGKIQVGPAKRVLYLMPYIDGWSNVLDNGDHFLLTDSAPSSKKAKWECCCNTCGTTNGYEAVYECESCEDEVTESDVCRVPNFGYYCRDCHAETFIYCEHTGREQLREGSDMVVVNHITGRRPHWREQLWCADAIDNDAFLCPIEGVWFANTLAVEYEGQTISLRAYQALNPPTPQPEPPPVPPQAFPSPSEYLANYHPVRTPPSFFVDPPPFFPAPPLTRRR
jgi:hypothetical protein